MEYLTSLVDMFTDALPEATGVAIVLHVDKQLPNMKLISCTVRGCTNNRREVIFTSSHAVCPPKFVKVIPEPLAAMAFVQFPVKEAHF